MTRRCRSSERSGRVTPYVVQDITDDALWAGRGSSLEATVQAAANEAIALVMDRFSWLGERGVTVKVRRARIALRPRPDGPGGA